MCMVAHDIHKNIQDYKISYYIGPPPDPISSFFTFPRHVKNDEM